MKPTVIYYATGSKFKKSEIELIQGATLASLVQGSETCVEKICEFVLTSVSTNEPLEIDLKEMIRHKARSAYKSLLMPCIVEHAGLVLEKDNNAEFPGGLTQPMWDSLSADGFLSRTGCRGERATARAVVGYCDGAKIEIFVGETYGVIANEPRGSREFYWDTIFCPDGFDGKTYAEIAEESGGLEKKIAISQSMKAICKFVQHIEKNGSGPLFGSA